MIITAHQPNYLPWIGLFHKIYLADRHIIYDDVEFTHYGFTNRTQILGKQGVKSLTVPVHRNNEGQGLIIEISIDNSNLRWQRKHWSTIAHCYGQAPYFSLYRERLSQIYERPWNFLVDLNVHLLELMLEFLGIKTPISRASALSLSGQKSDRVINLCQKLGANTFIFGSGGLNYVDYDAFSRNGIEPVFQSYRHPAYRQRGGQRQDFMSVIDLLFNCGPASLEILLSGQDTIENLRRRDATSCKPQ